MLHTPCSTQDAPHACPTGHEPCQQRSVPRAPAARLELPATRAQAAPSGETSRPHGDAPTMER
eukprot:98551-Chlamydomonas_euryale.AAC.2